MHRALIYGAASALVSGALAVGSAYLVRSERPNAGRPPAPDHPALEAAFEAQRARAAAVGLGEPRDGEAGTHHRAWDQDVTLGPGECAAFIVGPTGCRQLSPLTLSVDGTRIQRLPGSSVAVHQLQWCAFGEEAETVHVAAQSTPASFCIEEHRGRGGLRWEIWRGPLPADGLAGLNSVDPTDEARGAALVATARRWLTAHRPPGRALLSETNEGYDTGAVVRPGTAATCRAAYALANRGAPTVVHPRLAFPHRGVSCPPSGAPPAVIDAVRRRDAGEPERILAVLDRGDLGAPCVEIILARLRQGPVHAAPSRIDLADGTATALAPADGAPFVFRDASCPAEGLVAYVVSGDDHEAYRLDAHAVEGPPGAVARPAPVPERPFPTEPTLASAISEHQRRCDEGAAASCYALALAFRTGEGAPRDLVSAARRFRRGCDLGHPDACAYVGHAYDEGEGVDENDAEAERRYRVACHRGSALGCAFVGDLERLTPGAPPEAMRRARDHYATACDAGVQSACRNADLVSELDLL